MQLWVWTYQENNTYVFLLVIFVSIEFDISGLFGQIAQLPAWILLTYDPLSSTSLHNTTIPPEKSVSYFILVFVL